MSKDIIVTCENGHTLVLGDLDESIDPFDPKIRATIFPCQVEMSKPEHGGLILECGARITWKHYMPKKGLSRIVFTKNGVKRPLDKLNPDS